MRPSLNIVNDLATAAGPGSSTPTVGITATSLRGPATARSRASRSCSLRGPSPRATTRARHSAPRAGARQARDHLILGWLAEWRGRGIGADFAAWMRRQKVSAVDLALVRRAWRAPASNTELLAHIEGFAAVFDKLRRPTRPWCSSPAAPRDRRVARAPAETRLDGVDEAVRRRREAPGRGSTTTASMPRADHCCATGCSICAIGRHPLAQGRHRRRGEGGRIVSQHLRRHLPFPRLDARDRPRARVQRA